MDRSVRAWMPVVALLLVGVGALTAQAQVPAPPSTLAPGVDPLPNHGVSRLTWPVLSQTTPAASSLPSEMRFRELPSALPMPLVAPDRTPPEAVSTTPGTNPLAIDMKLKSSPVEPTDLRFPINLATALRLSDARPLIVAAAQASVWVAEAELTRAKVLWIPTLNLGFDYIRHDGGGPDFNKGIMTAPSVNFFYGGGGMWGTISTTDAIFEPLVARQVLNSRALGHPVGEERRHAPDRRRLLPRAPVPGDLRRRPLHGGAGP